MNIFLKVHLPEIHFPEHAPAINYIWPKTYFLEFTLAGIYIFPKAYFPEFALARIYICSILHLAQNLFFQNLYLPKIPFGRNYIYSKPCLNFF